METTPYGTEIPPVLPPSKNVSSSEEVSHSNSQELINKQKSTISTDQFQQQELSSGNKDASVDQVGNAQTNEQTNVALSSSDKSSAIQSNQDSEVKN